MRGGPIRWIAGAFERAFDKLTSLGNRKMHDEGIAAEAVQIHRQADMRYVGQSYELTIEIQPDAPDQIAAAIAAFHDRHESFYGHCDRAAPVEFVNLRTVHVHRAETPKRRRHDERRSTEQPNRWRTARPISRPPADS